ncbi:hypothetical protein SBF1_600003 [Candidatus Desulfosporosinus infrequens]|uniref:Uncharacterized protein n=1 Tax=Candidatus Desulfosporosinus infrequens TaxID=2043169 RepID=A0A2U3LLE0_9FIRM|nr:hypothetical protein SBF1_600003 [Candidatus Desulfosporosinus infrequens]
MLIFTYEELKAQFFSSVVMFQLQNKFEEEPNMPILIDSHGGELSTRGTS